MEQKMYQISKEDVNKIIFELNSLKNQADSVIKVLQKAISDQPEDEKDKDYDDPDEYLMSWSDSIVFNGDPDNYNMQ